MQTTAAKPANILLGLVQSVVIINLQKIVSLTKSNVTLFFRLGSQIGKHPWITIALALLFAGLCGIGMIKFTQENRGEKLWNPQDSVAQKNKKWVEDRYPPTSHVSNVLYEDSDVLTPEVIVAVSIIGIMAFYM